MEFISDIMQYGFMQKALFTSVMVGIICGIVGCFIVLRGLALMGDAISHAVLPGVAVSFMLDINFFYGSVAAGILAALGIGYVNQNSRIKSDSSIGIVFTAFLALGVLLIRHAQSGVSLDSILFGSLTAVQTSDMWLTLIVGAIVLLVVILFYKELLVSTFDPIMAAAYGLPTRLIHYVLMILLTLVTVASMQTVGVILVVAMLVTPASTAYLLTNRMWVMLVLSSLFGVLASLVGLYFSFAHDLESGAVIVITSFIMFALVFFFSPKQGLLWRMIRSKRKQIAINR
ncbi:metal ABC transporter permease [Virgibacillus sp. NKC19-3]|uniref:metal ABC transporter permease n=1 Tax=Virgibacillus saliphilus TaxID=2831674 RepID=UPI001C9B6573|nr:metal ABC transporter permease [Virgibacillus sp. NKC19-3]MBY7144172.1 metal ABC transporter permease [Virgibacillus sp. NKC19-3]